MADCLQNLFRTTLLLKEVFNRRRSCIARHMKRFGRGVSRQFVQRQTDEDYFNFYDRFLKWLYAIEASTHEGSRLIILDLLARFPLMSEPERRKLSVTEFLEHLSKVYTDILAAAYSGNKGLMKVKLLEMQFLSMSQAESL